MKFMFSAIVVLVAGVAICQANPISYIPYAFGYQTADGMSRQESGSNGVVSGSYSYTDANGDLRQVRYTADENGYRPVGDIGVDRRTAAAAAELALLAPKESVAAAHAAQLAVPLTAANWGHHASYTAAPFASFNSFQAPAAVPVAHSAANAWSQHSGFGAAGPFSYQVDTPTHKIWVRY